MGRKVKIVTIQPLQRLPEPYFDYCAPDIEQELENAPIRARETIDRICNLVEQSCGTGPDVVCTPEFSGGLSVHPCLFMEKSQYIETMLRPTYDYAVNRYAEVAKKNRIHLVTCVYEPCGEEIFNTGMIISRQGEIVGRYQKTHLPSNEGWIVSPGTNYSVFETDFGKVGILICYDMHFPEPCRILALRGAEIVFNPTVGYDFCGELIGEMRVRIRAVDNGVYIVVSNFAYPDRRRPGRSSIVAPDGVVLADAGKVPDRFVAATVDLDEENIEPADAETSGIGDLGLRQLLERHPETYSYLTECEPDALSKWPGARLLDDQEVRAVYLRRRRQAIE